MSELQFLKRVISTRKKLISKNVSHKNQHLVAKAMAYYVTWLEFYGAKCKDSGARALIKMHPERLMLLIPGKESKCHEAYMNQLTQILKK